MLSYNEIDSMLNEDGCGLLSSNCERLLGTYGKLMDLAEKFDQWRRGEIQLREVDAAYDALDIDNAKPSENL